MENQKSHSETRNEWLAKRKIGSSDAPVIMGLFPYGKTPYMLWEEKTFGAVDRDNKAMKRGRDMEPLALECYQNKVGVDMTPQIFWQNDNPDLQFMTATFDGVNFDKSRLVEIKCVKAEYHEMAKNGEIPLIYYPQVQHQMVVADMPEMDYFSFDGKDGVIVTVKRDDAFCADMINREREFYRRVIEIEPPDLTEKDLISMEDVVDVAELWHTLSLRLREIDPQLSSLEREYEDIKSKLKNLAAGKSVYGFGVKLTRSFSAGSVDYKSIPEIKDVDLDKYRKKPVEKWRLSIQ